MFGKFFDQEGPVFVFLSKMADMAILNLLFLVCCLPVFTIGAALTGLAYVTLKMNEGEEGYILKSFFKSFKQNFKQATLMWLMMLLFAVILYMDFSFAQQMGGMVGTAFMVFVAVGSVFWFFILSYAFPLLARFDNTIRGTFRNALLMALGNAPRMILMALIFGGSIFLTAWNVTTITWGTLIWVLFGFALMSYANSYLQLNMFRRFMPEKEEETDPDAWEVPEE